MGLWSAIGQWASSRLKARAALPRAVRHADDYKRNILLQQGESIAGYSGRRQHAVKGAHSGTRGIGVLMKV